MDSITIYTIVIVLVSVTIVISSIGIVIAVRFQKEQRKKYSYLKKIVEENKDITFAVKDSLTPEEITAIDSSIIVDELMADLYQTYLAFENKIKDFDDNLDDILTGNLKEFYINKINNYKKNGYKDVNESIDLMGYSISEFNREQLKFKINLNCFNYKMIYDKIVSGSNQYKVNQIVLITYNKVADKWLISAYDKIYEKKLGE